MLHDTKIKKQNEVEKRFQLMREFESCVEEERSRIWTNDPCFTIIENKLKEKEKLKKELDNLKSLSRIRSELNAKLTQFREAREQLEYDISKENRILSELLVVPSDKEEINEENQFQQTANESVKYGDSSAPKDTFGGFLDSHDSGIDASLSNTYNEEENTSWSNHSNAYEKELDAGKFNAENPSSKTTSVFPNTTFELKHSTPSASSSLINKTNVIFGKDNVTPIQRASLNVSNTRFTPKTNTAVNFISSRYMPFLGSFIKLIHVSFSPLNVFFFIFE